MPFIHFIVIAVKMRSFLVSLIFAIAKADDTCESNGTSLLQFQPARISTMAQQNTVNVKEVEVVLDSDDNEHFTTAVDDMELEDMIDSEHNNAEHKKVSALQESNTAQIDCPRFQGSRVQQERQIARTRCTGSSPNLACCYMQLFDVIKLLNPRGMIPDSFVNGTTVARNNLINGVGSIHPIDCYNIVWASIPLKEQWHQTCCVVRYGVGRVATLQNNSSVKTHQVQAAV